MNAFNQSARPLKIAEVFTPRRAEVNLRTYVPRPDLENALIRAVQGSMHSILFGESGNGKSWLYMKALRQIGYHYKVANCANASRMGSLTEEIFNCLIPAGEVRKSGYSETKEAGVNAGFAVGKLNHQGTYVLHQDEPLLAALNAFRNSIGKGADAVLILDNLESIFKSDKLMSELADIIILLDDRRYASANIKLLIVGVPNGVLEYFGRTKNLESVANRLEELPKVGGMTLPMTRTIVQRGFNQLLGFEIAAEDIESIACHIHNVTLGIAQRIHEYCEKLAHEIDNNNKRYSVELLRFTDNRWLTQGMRQAYVVVESHLNSKRTTVARKNQVIYCIGRITGHQVDAARLAEKIRDEFPNNSKDTDMGIGSILSELASGDSPLLIKNPKANGYRVADPRYLMCIRTILRKEDQTTVTKVNFRI